MKKTPLCKVCLTKKVNPSINDIFVEVNMCEDCFMALKVTFKEEKIEGCSLLTIYEYNEGFKSLLYNFKALSDIALAPIFLERYLTFLRLRYHNYLVIPLPSTTESNEARGFNHVEEMIKGLKLKIIPLLFKKVNFKQSDLHFNERQEVAQKLGIKESSEISGKNILIVDDLKTTGASLKAAIKLVKTLNPKKISLLTLAATKDAS